MTEVADVLNRAADLLEKPGAWTQGAFARADDGTDLDDFSRDDQPVPACFCLYGAIGHVIGQHPEQYCDADQYLMKAIGVGSIRAVADWNDATARTQAEVVDALRRAAAAAGKA